MESGVTTYYKLGAFSLELLSQDFSKDILTESPLDLISDYVSSEQSLDGLRVFALDARVLWLLARGNQYAKQSYNKVDYILPDGRPIFWIKRLEERRSFEQVTGPGLFQEILSNTELKRKKHVFYGGTLDTMEKLVAICTEKDVNLVHFEVPPFLSIDNLDIAGVQSMLNKYKPDFFWCGLGAPKQEHLISQLQAVNVVMIGVGLAFDYAADNVKKAPKFVSIVGMEWVVRYFQQPLRIKRFVFPFFFTLGLVFRHSLIRIFSFRHSRNQ